MCGPLRRPYCDNPSIRAQNKEVLVFCNGDKECRDVGAGDSPGVGANTGVVVGLYMGDGESPGESAGYVPGTRAHVENNV